MEKETEEIKPHEEATEVINLGTTDRKKEVKIGTTLKKIDRKKLIDLLLKYEDVFAWLY